MSFDAKQHRIIINNKRPMKARKPCHKVYQNAEIQTHYCKTLENKIKTPKGNANPNRNSVTETP